MKAIPDKSEESSYSSELGRLQRSRSGQKKLAFLSAVLMATGHLAASELLLVGIEPMLHSGCGTAPTPALLMKTGI